MTAPAITMINSSGLKVHSSEQHFEMGATRTKRDYNDCKKFLKWLEERNPFLCSSKNLHSLSTGLVSITGHDDVNCENAEDIGFKITTLTAQMLVCVKIAKINARKNLKI